MSGIPALIFAALFSEIGVCGFRNDFGEGLGSQICDFGFSGRGLRVLVMGSRV